MALDFDARYSVDGSPGIAFFLLGYVVERSECQGHPCEDAPHFFPHAGIGDSFYCDGACEEPQENRERVIAVMVGDNRKHDIDVDDLTPINDDDYCSCCGQIGCSWG